MKHTGRIPLSHKWVHGEGVTTYNITCQYYSAHVGSIMKESILIELILLCPCPIYHSRVRQKQHLYAIYFFPNAELYIYGSRLDY